MTGKEVIKKYNALDGKIRDKYYIDDLIFHAESAVQSEELPKEMVMILLGIMDKLNGVLNSYPSRKSFKITITDKYKIPKLKKKAASKKPKIRSAYKEVSRPKGLNGPVTQDPLTYSEAIAKTKEPEIEKPDTPIKDPIRTDVPKSTTPIPAQKQVQKVIPGLTKKRPVPAGKSLADKFKNKSTRPRQFFTLLPEFNAINEFLGKVEIMDEESAVMTLSAEQGAGKSTAFFQFMNAFASSGYKCLHVSLEEHVNSYLYEKKAVEYLSDNALENITAPVYSKNNISSLDQDIKDHDVIFIDSMKKLWQFIKGVDLDNDFRKKYNGKLFIIIFQLTQDGKMKGGSDAQFDGDIISFIHKADEFKNNYIYHNKNRYAVKPIHQTKYNIVSQSIVGEQNEDLDLSTAKYSDFSYTEVS